MKRFYFIAFVGALFLYPISASAGTDPVNSDSPVTATIPQATATPGSDTTVPSIPILVRPADGAVTGDTTPELVWLHATDPNSNYVVYTVYVNGVATYLGISDTGNSSAANYTSTVYDNEVRLIPLAALSDGTYSWKVRATDASGNYSESTVWSFTIDTVAPPLSVEQIGSHTNPTITEGSRFEVAGPGVIPLRVLTDPYIDVRLTITYPDGVVVTHSGATDASGRIIFTDNLDRGEYTYQVSATDRANLTTLLPLFTVAVTQAEIIIPVPGVSPPPVIVVPPLLTQIGSSLYNYPATVSQIATRSHLAPIIAVTLAIAIILLLIFLKKRYNLVIMSATNTPAQLVRVVATQENGDRVYQTDRHGRTYIPAITKRSQLRIELTNRSVALCLTRRQRCYTLIID